MKTQIQARSGQSVLQLTGRSIVGTITNVSARIDQSLTGDHATGEWSGHNASIRVSSTTFSALSTRPLPFCLELVTSGSNVTGCTSSASCSASAGEPAGTPP